MQARSGSPLPAGVQAALSDSKIIASEGLLASRLAVGTHPDTLLDPLRAAAATAAQAEAPGQHGAERRDDQ